MRRVFDEIAAAWLERLRIHPHAMRAEAAAHVRQRSYRYDFVAAADIDLVRQTKRYRLRRIGRLEIAVIRDDARDAGSPPRRERHHLFALVEYAGRDLP